MDINNCFLLGYVSKHLGFKGEVVLYIDADEPERYLEMESVLIKKANTLIPFFIEKIQPHSRSKQFIVKFNDIDNTEQAEILIGCEVYLPLESLPKLEGKQFYFHEVIGFSLYDINKGMIGKINDVIDVSSNPIFQVYSGKTEILLPVNDSFIDSVDRTGKKIIYKAPEGLIDMYLDDNTPETDD